MENPRSTPNDPQCHVWKELHQAGNYLGDYCGAGYARSQYRIVLQSYPSPIPTRLRVPCGRIRPTHTVHPGNVHEPGLGCRRLRRLQRSESRSDARSGTRTPPGPATRSFRSSRTGWPRSQRTSKSGSSTCRDFLQGREICSNQARNELFSGPPSASGSESARTIYLLAQANVAQGDDKEAIHPNAYAQRGLQRCATSAYDYVWNQNLATVHLKCINQPGGYVNVTTQVLP